MPLIASLVPFQATRRAQDHRTTPRSNEPITARQVSQRVAVGGLGASANGPSAPAKRKCACWPPCHAARARERGACRRRPSSASPSARRPCRRSRRAGVAASIKNAGHYKAVFVDAPDAGSVEVQWIELIENGRPIQKIERAGLRLLDSPQHPLRRVVRTKAEQ